MKSIWKGLKYAGISVAAGGLVGIGGVVPNLVFSAFNAAGAPEVIGAIASGYLTPLIAGAIAVALEQVRKHGI